MNFELCRYFILFLSTSSAVSVRTGGNLFPVSYKLRSVTVLNSTIGFFILTLGVLIFFKIFGHNCMFYAFTFFPCRIIITFTGPIERKHGRENAQRWKKAYLDMLNVFIE